MIDINHWLFGLEKFCFVPLFEVNDNLVVKTRLSGKNERRLLLRNKKMERSIIELVEENVGSDQWEGLFYIMGKGDRGVFHPLYIGKTEKRGVKNPLSENIKNIRSNKGKFARWGDGVDYHIGGLSQAIFGFQAYKRPSKKYIKWSEVIFKSFDPPQLREPIYIFIAPWYQGIRGISGLVSSLPALEKELIALASVQYGDVLLNVDGR